MGTGAKPRRWILALCIALGSVGPSASGAVKEVILYSFGNRPDGEYPFGKLLLGPNGKLYGTTSGGGQFGNGSAFELSRSGSGWKTTILHSFTGNVDGYAPQGGLIADSEGNLYGTASEGGDLNCGILGCGNVFELSPTNNGWTFNVLYDFVGGSNDGDLPTGDLVFDGAGNLYGATIHGGGIFDGGVVFELSPVGGGSWQETAIYIFGAEGGAPNGDLVFDSAGNLYGTTELQDSLGSVFQLTDNSGTWTKTDLLDFGGSFGENPMAGLAMDAAGDLYGTTTRGGNDNCFGSFGCGTIFEVSPNGKGKGGWTTEVLYAFNGGSDGQNPEGVLLLDKAGNLYGTTNQGGGSGCEFGFGCGTVFRLAHNNGAWSETVLHSFGIGSDGQSPVAGPITDNAGHLLGVTDAGGKNDYGVVFALFKD
jgi:uncharacterized repeat protein (TIGR03803 family)